MDTLFAASLVRLFRASSSHAVGAHLAYQSGPHIALARDAITRWFLDTGLPWLLQIDSDMVFQPDDVTALLEAGEAGHPIVSGVYTSYIPATGEARIVAGDQRGNVQPGDLDGGLLDVTSVGTGFLLVHRDVFLGLAKRSDAGRLPWFEELTVDGAPLPQDWVFCRRAVAAGYPIVLHTGVVVGHCKRVPLYPRDLIARQVAS